MKRITVLFALFFILVISGCSKIDVVPVYVQPDTCTDCEEKPVCAKETKVIRYQGACSGSCGYPVTVRKTSDCDRGGM